jgi:type IV pilus assembly protein PilB
MVTLKDKYNQLLTVAKDKKKTSWGKPTQGQDANLTSEIVDLILSEAILNRASDIHVEPQQKFIRIRFRIDGKLYNMLEVVESPEIFLIARFKIMANIPTDNVSSRKAWDSRFSMTLYNQQYDFRVATFPTLMGDKMAIRVLNKNSELVDLKKIGLRPQAYATLEQIMQRKSGLLIVSGPTGGGKTTTLYSILGRLNSPSVNIVTLENPVEYQIDGLNQCDINKKVSEDFASALKATLRQDPDVILVGEIRDLESAEIALRASITGHFVMTSIHANSAIGTVARLINMGLERSLIAYSMVGSVSQHLVPRICESCRVPYTIDPVGFNKICAQCGVDPNIIINSTPKTGNEEIHYVTDDSPSALDKVTFFKGKGCEICKGTGYLGMTGVFEVVEFTEGLREAILNNASVSEIENLAVSKGFQSMAVDALQKVKSGIIHFDDIYHILLEKVR